MASPGGNGGEIYCCSKQQRKTSSTNNVPPQQQYYPSPQTTGNWHVMMVPLTVVGVLTLASAVLCGASGLEESSCLSAKTAKECKSQIEEGTGDQCVWCTCRAVPSECLGASLAKV